MASVQPKSPISYLRRLGFAHFWMTDDLVSRLSLVAARGCEEVVNTEFEVVHIVASA